VTGFLFDENLPYCLQIQTSFPIHHSKDVGLSPSDNDLWLFAKSRNLAVVSKDADFSDRILISGPPPWIVHLRFGNLHRKAFHAYMKQIWPRVEGLLPEAKLINVYLDRIETVS
jgi:predicted nuclease of predicted toxin-antitoxin system